MTEEYFLNKIFESLAGFGLVQSNVTLKRVGETTDPPAFVANQDASTIYGNIMTFSLINV
jgi:hypothetical protein